MDETSKEYKLALELAETLHDTDSLLFYCSLTKLHSEALLREVLRKVLAVPNEKIKKSRAALYNYMIQQHVYKRSYHTRN